MTSIATRIASLQHKTMAAGDGNSAAAASASVSTAATGATAEFSGGRPPSSPPRRPVPSPSATMPASAFASAASPAAATVAAASPAASASSPSTPSAASSNPFSFKPRSSPVASASTPVAAADSPSPPTRALPALQSSSSFSTAATETTLTPSSTTSSAGGNPFTFKPRQAKPDSSSASPSVRFAPSSRSSPHSTLVPALSHPLSPTPLAPGECASPTFSPVAPGVQSSSSASATSSAASSKRCSGELGALALDPAASALAEADELRRIEEAKAAIQRAYSVPRLPRTPSSSPGSTPSLADLSAKDFYALPARQWDENVVSRRDGEFLPLSEWVALCLSGGKTPGTGSRAELTRTLLLTLTYHSSPYELLRIVLDHLKAPPPTEASDAASGCAGAASPSGAGAASPAAASPLVLLPSFGSTVHSFSAWHSSKLHALLFLGEWVKTYPADFCTRPLNPASSSSSAGTPSSTTTAAAGTTPSASGTTESASAAASASTATAPKAGHSRSNSSSSGGGLSGSGSGGDWSHLHGPPRLIPERLPQARKHMLEDLLVPFLASWPPHLGSSPGEWNHPSLNQGVLVTLAFLAGSLVRAYEAARAQYRLEDPSAEQVAPGGGVAPVLEGSASGSASASHSGANSPARSASPSLGGESDDGGAEHSSSASSNSSVPSHPPAHHHASGSGGGGAGPLMSPIPHLSRTPTPWSRNFGTSAFSANLVKRNMDSPKVKKMLEIAAAAGAPAAGSSEAFTAEFLSYPARSYANALAWLAIQRVEEIGCCQLTSLADGGPPIPAVKRKPSFHVAQHMRSSGFLRLFLSMPPALAKRQMVLSNTMSCFVATSVLLAPASQRTKVVEHWVAVAEACLGLLPDGGGRRDPTVRAVNFMHAFEVSYGLNHQAVYRLPVDPTASKASLPLLHKRSFAHPRAYDAYARLTQLTSPTSNYKEYRRALHEASLESSASSDSSSVAGGGAGGGAAGPPGSHVFHIPYLGILLKDLVGLEEAGKPLAGIHGDDAGEDDSDGEDEGEDAGADEGDSAREFDSQQTTLYSRSASSSVLDGADNHSSLVMSPSTSSADHDDHEHEPQTPTSLPWDDCFLVRPRGNATLTASALSGGGGAGRRRSNTTGGSPSNSSAPKLRITAPNRNSVLRDIGEEDLFALSSSPPPAAADPAGGDDDSWRARKFTPMVVLKEEVPLMSDAPMGLRAKRVSLLSAALPQRAPPAIVIPASAPSSARSSFSAPSAIAPPPVFVLNHSKLSKIRSIVSDTLECRHRFPTLPVEEDDVKGKQKRHRVSLADRVTMANHVAKTSGTLVWAVTAAALHPNALNDPLHVPHAPSLAPIPLSKLAQVPSLPFEPRLQHWLVSHMVTVVLKEEAQLMERSYAIFPRKVAAGSKASDSEA